MKTLLIIVSDAFFTKNYLRGTFWDYLTKGRAFRIILVCSEDKLNAYQNEFSGPNLVVVSFGSIPTSRSEKILSFIARNALYTGHVRMHQMKHYVEYGGFALLILKTMLWYFGGRSRLLRGLVRWVDLQIEPCTWISTLLDTHKPDVVFSASIMNPSLDVAVLREAKRRKITTVGLPRGWDNFTSKGILRVIPDTLLVQDQYLQDMGVMYQSLMRESMRIVGFPVNDWFVRKDLIVPREEFLARLGIDASKRIILFCALGDQLIPNEWEIAELFERLMSEKKLPADLLMVYRAHPSNPSKPEMMKDFKYVIYERKAQYSSGTLSSWEMSKEDITHYINVITHSEVVVTTGSTAGIDAIAMGKPVISEAYDSGSPPYWISAKRFRKHFTHYIDLIATGGIAAADNEKEFLYALSHYLEDPSSDQAGRLRLIERFIAPLDGKSGERVATAVIAQLM